LACAGIVAALIGRLAVPDGREAHAVSSRATVTARARDAEPALPGVFHGYLLIADRGNNRMLLVDGAKRVLWGYPRRTPGMPFRFDDDTFFGPTPNRIISNQEDQHTIQVIAFPSGRVLWRYGHTNVRGGAPGYLNTPDDAYLLRNGLVSVADAYNCRVLFIARSHRVVRQYGTTRMCRHDPPEFLGAVNGATPLPNGGTLVSEITGSWIDDIGPGGRLRWAVQAPVSYPSDPQPLSHGRILLADYARPGHVIIMDRHGRVLWRYGPASGPGELDHPSLAASFTPGLIAVNDDYRHRVVFINMRTRRIVWQYGHTDVPGRAPGYLNTPDGMAFLSAREIDADPVLRRLATSATVRPPVPVPSQRSAQSLKLTVRAASFSLPAPVEREVAVKTGMGIVIAGGLDSAQQSTNGVYLLDPHTGSLRRLGFVPEPFHDGAAAVIGHRLFVFGGGAATSSSAVQAFDLQTHDAAVVAHLARPLSDLVAATTGRAVYLVGGYDGTMPRSEIYRTYDGVHFDLVGRLPVGLRYPAVSAANGDLFIAGGVSASGPSSAVYRFDAGTRDVSTVGQLPVASAHAVAITVGSGIEVLGGSPEVSARIATNTLVVEPAGGRLDDANGAVVGGRTSFVLGGDVAGRIVRTVWEIRAR
jgi:Kelch motif